MRFHPQGDVIRITRKDPVTGALVPVRYFSKLSFSYTFTPKDNGTSVVFAYAVPYGYTDLLNDLDEIKKTLMADEHFQHYRVLRK